MSRSGYSDDCDNGWKLIMWRGAVASAIKGKRGQAFLREMLVALDAMPEKRLIGDEALKTDEGVCAIGAVGDRRGIDMSALDPENWNQVAKAFGIAPALVREISYENDETVAYWLDESPEHRYHRVRRWVERQINTG